MKSIALFGFSALIGLAACQDLGNSTGYVPAHEEIAAIKLGGDTRESIQERFGAPTVIGETDGIWYYISSRREYVGPLPPREIERRILVVRFEGERVAAVSEFGQEIGQDIPISRYTTETGGRELTLLEQLRGNIGNFSAENFLQGQ